METNVTPNKSIHATYIAAGEPFWKSVINKSKRNYFCKTIAKEVNDFIKRASCKGFKVNMWIETSEELLLLTEKKTVKHI